MVDVFVGMVAGSVSSPIVLSVTKIVTVPSYIVFTSFPFVIFNIGAFIVGMLLAFVLLPPTFRSHVAYASTIPAYNLVAPIYTLLASGCRLLCSGGNVTAMFSGLCSLRCRCRS